MIVVTPQTKTTLVVNRYHQAFNVCTARAAIRHLMSGRVKGIDAKSNIVSWTGADLDLAGHSTLRWYNNEVSLFDDQPCLRSAPDPLTGEEKKWAIPTIIVCTYHFGYQRRAGENVPLKVIYRVYKGICAYCYEKIPYSKATKDHVYPKSAGGTNHDFNLVLACRDCNSAKDDIHPYYDINGKEIKPRKINDMMFIPEGIAIREEWKPYLPSLMD